MLEEAPEQSTENNGAEIVRCELQKQYITWIQCYKTIIGESSLLANLNGFAESLEHLRVRKLSATSTQPQDRWVISQQWKILV